jgi:hypothetical protein
VARPLRHTHPQPPLYLGGLVPPEAISPDVVTQHQNQLTLDTSQIAGLDAELALLAPLASPALTGDPTAPTAAAGTNTTQIATTAFVLANGSSPSRSTTATTTVSLAAQATDSTKTAALGKSGVLLRVTTDRPARVRLYATSAALTADAARPVGTDPTGEAEVLLDLVTTSATLDFVLSPKVPYSNDETAPVSTIPMSVQNLDTITSTVTVTFTKITMET